MPELNKAQQLAYSYSHIHGVPEVHMVTGVGVGKTYALGVWLLPNLIIPNSRHLICSPTVPMMKNSTLPGILDAWAQFGIVEERDFVINKRMPNVPAYSKIGSDNVITFRWGAYCVLTSLENYNTVNGSQWDSIVVDECRDVRNFKEALGKLRARNRGVKFKQLGRQHQILTATTPPDNPAYFIELRDSPDPNIAVIHASSYMNEANLPYGYISRLKDTYDDLTFRREVMGELIVATDSKWLYTFDRELHTMPALHIEKDQRVYLSFDFNVSPLTCIACQHSYDNSQIRVIKEFRLINSDVTEMSVAVRKWLRDTFGDTDTRRLIVTGDSSGRNRTSISIGESNWNRLVGDLALHPSQVKVPARNPSLGDSIMLCNSVMQKHGDIIVDSGNCPYLIKDMEFCQRDEQNKVVAPDAMHGHLFDCFRYYLWVFHSGFLRKFAKENKHQYPAAPPPDTGEWLTKLNL